MNEAYIPGPPATGADLRAAQDRQDLLRTELARVRTAAVAWRNALAGILAAMVSFSLIKGRSDVSQLAAGWAPVAGMLLLAAFLVGTVGALSLVRAANGRPSIAATRELLPRAAADHLEALAAASALRRGIWTTVACATLLIGAVGTTWYGPERTGPALRVTTPSGAACGTVVGTNGGVLTLRTVDGEVSVDLTRAITVAPVKACSP